MACVHIKFEIYAKFSDDRILRDIALISKKLNFFHENLLYSNYILRRYYDKNCISLRICLSGKISICEIIVTSLFGIVLD